MVWKNRKTLVTGAGGFVGSHLVGALIARGANVRALIHYNSRNDIGNLRFLNNNLLDKVEIILGDVQDAGCVYEAVNGCDCVFHLAALIGIPHSYAAPRSYMATNVLGTLNVLEAARRLGTGRMLYVSSSEVYGTPVGAPIDEGHRLQAQSPYSATKIAADKLVESYNRSFGVPAIVVRPFNMYGPRQSVRAVIPEVITQLLSGKGEVVLRALTPRRDFTFVEDTVEGFVAAAECGEAIGEAINIGSGKNISMCGLARMIIDIINPEAKVVFDAIQLDDEVIGPVCDNSKAARMLGWHPKVSMEGGLRRTVQFIREQRKGIK